MMNAALNMVARSVEELTDALSNDFENFKPKFNV
jgi:hypothetical protein